MVFLSLRTKAQIEQAVSDVLGGTLLELVRLEPPVAIPSWPSPTTSGAVQSVSLSSVVPEGTVAVLGLSNFQLNTSPATNLNIRIRSSGNPAAAGDQGHLIGQCQHTAQESRTAMGRFWVSQLNASRQLEVIYFWSGTPSVAVNNAHALGYYIPVSSAVSQALASRQDSNQSFGGTGFNAIVWDTEHKDTSGFITLSNSQVGIPSGVSAVKVRASCRITPASTLPQLALQLNGGDLVGLGWQDFVVPATGDAYATVSGIASVTPGDYIELGVVSDTAGDVVVAGNHTWISVEVIGEA